MPHFSRRIDRLRWRIVAARQEAAAPLVVEADFRVVYVRTPLPAPHACVLRRLPSDTVVNGTVVRAGSTLAHEGMFSRGVDPACWSTVSLDTTHTVEANHDIQTPPPS